MNERRIETGQEPALGPWYMTEEIVRERPPGLLCGFTSKTKADCDWFETRLDWLRPINPVTADGLIPHGDPKQALSSVWEFHTTSPYTD